MSIVVLKQAEMVTTKIPRVLKTQLKVKFFSQPLQVREREKIENVAQWTVKSRMAKFNFENLRES